MPAPLIPCHACARHVFADASRCPFCDAAREPQAPPTAPAARTTRAAMAALGAVLATAPMATLLAYPDVAEAQTHGAAQPAQDTDAGTHRDAAVPPEVHHPQPPPHPRPRPVYGMPPRR